MKRRSRANFENRCLHHHVFDPALITAMFEVVELTEIMQTETAIDYVAIARKVMP